MKLEEYAIVIGILLQCYLLYKYEQNISHQDNHIHCDKGLSISL